MEIKISRIKFPHGEKSVVILKESVDHITPCATKHSICFYTRNKLGQGFIGLYKYTDRGGLDGVVYDEKWKVSKQDNFEKLDKFLDLYDQLF